MSPGFASQHTKIQNKRILILIENVFECRRRKHNYKNEYRQIIEQYCNTIREKYVSYIYYEVLQTLTERKS